MLVLVLSYEEAEENASTHVRMKLLRGQKMLTTRTPLNDRFSMIKMARKEENPDLQNVL